MITDRNTPYWIAAASLVFALSVPMAEVVPQLGHLLLVAHLIAIGVPALRRGARGALAGALASVVAFTASDLASLLAKGDLNGLVSDLGIVATMSATLAIVFGAMGEALRRHRVLAEQARASEQRYNDLINNLPSGLLLTTPAGRIDLANAPAAQLLGRTVEELIGVNLADVVDANDWRQLAMLVAEPRPTLPLRAGVTMSNGDHRRTDWVCSRHATPNGSRSLAYFWDAEETIRHEEERSVLGAALESLREGVVLTDLEGRISFANPAAAELYGYPSAAAMTGVSLTRHVSPDMLEAFADRLRQAHTTGWSEEAVVIRLDGGEVRVRATMSPVIVGDRLVATVGVISDLTEQHAIAERAVASDKLATLGRLVAGAAHEINNPLAAVLANAELLQVGGAVSPQALQDSLATIVSEGRRAGRIVRDLLSFARQQPVARVTVDLHALVCDVMALRTRYLKARGIDLVLEADDSCTLVNADADQMKQVLLNLLVNAEDAVRDRPQPRITVKVARAVAVALVCVDDSGPGIPRDLRQRIFEPFFTTKPQGQGTGLGLSVSYGIVREHGGHIWTERSPLGGARFVVQIPMVESTAEVPRIGRSSNPSLATTGRRVLVVDDESALRDAARRILARFGHQVQTAESGSRALELLRTDQFDVMICDLRMPGMTGPEVYRVARREGLLERTAFVVTTGDIADPQSAGFVHAENLPVLLKPFELVSLVDLVSAPIRAVA